MACLRRLFGRPTPTPTPPRPDLERHDELQREMNQITQELKRRNQLERDLFPRRRSP